MKPALIVLLLSSVVCAQRVDRYWGSFNVGSVALSAGPDNGGSENTITTNEGILNLNAVIKVEEAQRSAFAQNSTFEWVGLDAVGNVELLNQPNLTFEGRSSERFDSGGFEIDLNPFSPSVWASNHFAFPVGPYEFDGLYQSVSDETSFRFSTDEASAVFSTGVSSSRVEQLSEFSIWTPQVSELDFSDYPEIVTARYEPNEFEIVYVTNGGPQSVSTAFVDFEPKDVIELENNFKFNSVSFQHGVGGVANFIHTPTGDANNDGQVGFDDFLILSTNFGQQNARWIDGDFDGDAHVAFSDFLGMSENFGGVVAAVPEPSGFSLALVALMGLRRRQR